MRHDGKPFRWNTANPRLPSRLKPGDTQVLPEHQQDRLLRCGASVICAGDLDFVFVGRSLESLYDTLSGALARTSWYSRLQLLQISLRGYESVEAIRGEIQRRNARYLRLKCKSFEDRIQSLQNYFRVLQLTPEQILARDRGVAFVDVVEQGTTFGTLLELLSMCCEAEGAWEAACRRLHLVAVQPDAPSAEQPVWPPADSPWTSQVEAEQIHRVVIDADLWSYLAAEQFKTAPAYPPWRWGENIDPPSEAWDEYAARGARALYRRGERTRTRLASLLDQPPEPVDAIKELARELRRESGRR